MGRRVFYKEEVNGVVTKHHRFVYDNYLCVQKVDALNNNAQINLFVWDPTEPIATRPLFTTGSGNRKFFYTCDGNKNVSELVHFETRNGIAAHYDYAPFGAVTRAISASTITNNTFTTDNPFRFSSEYHDDTLGLVYYNYRHYNPTDGRWCGRDRFFSKNEFFFKGGNGFDYLGNEFKLEIRTMPMDEIGDFVNLFLEEDNGVYQAFTVVTRQGWRSDLLPIVWEEVSPECICGTMDLPQYDMDVLVVLPTTREDLSGRRYSIKGLFEVYMHEFRRVLALRYMYEAFFKEYESNKQLRKCARTKVEVNERLNEEAQTLRNTVISNATQYINTAMEQIEEENTSLIITAEGEVDGYRQPHWPTMP